MRHLPLAALLIVGAGCAPPPSPPPPEEPGPQVTWHRDIAPLIEERCGGCHHPEGIAPFSLQTLEQVRGQIAAIQEAVHTRKMPPMLAAEENCEPILHSPRLTNEQLALIDTWVDLQMPEGDPADAPPQVARSTGLEWTDAEISPAEPYTPQPRRGNEDYRCFAINPELAVDRHVIGYDVVAGTPRQVHHVLLFTADEADVKARDAASAGPGWPCFGGIGVTTYQILGGWAPGTQATEFPRGTGLKVFAGKWLVMQVHYNLANGPAEEDHTRVRLQYTRQQMPKDAFIIPVWNDDFAIPPHTQGYSAEGSQELPVAGQIWGAGPHMHTLGRSLKMQVDDGRCLVDVKDWDFHWQQSYLFANGGIPVQAGQRVKLKCTWDNPTDQTVRWGAETSDEMCLAFFYFTQ